MGCYELGGEQQSDLQIQKISLQCIFKVPPGSQAKADTAAAILMPPEVVEAEAAIPRAQQQMPQDREAPLPCDDDIQLSPHYHQHTEAPIPIVIDAAHQPHNHSPGYHPTAPLHGTDWFDYS